MLGLFIISGIIGLFVLALIIFAFIFWIWMLIDAIGNNRLSSSQRIVWVLVILFLHGLGALIYYFAGREGT
ncbi:MAG TPA: PLDc N-terminal domain-containing protein [Verrucomicrobiae bacterium]|nr:PLDc N-terminal domain-containing protein [Verrucomicrobiae bacterium]